MSIFSHVQAKKPRYNTFDLSHDRKMSMNMGELVPIFCAEAVPGDRFSMSTSQMLRFAPMLAPVMHRVTVYTHFFFVPNRIIWPNWENFITGGEDGMDTTVYPYINHSVQIETGSLFDYLGLPTDVSGIGRVSALPLAAYLKIYNEYYRDQNLIEPYYDTLVDGANNSQMLASLGSLASATPLKRSWQHDYFTSALPWTQKGPQATIPLFSEDPIVRLTDRPAGIDSQRWQTNAGNSPYTGPAEFSAQRMVDTAPLDAQNIIFNPGESLELGTDSTSATINDLRQAFRLQEWLEKNARGGARYKETILSHFGVHSSDARLQRPQFLGGGSTPVTISEVLQTSDASAQETPQGNMAGHGISVGKNHSFSYRTEEHGFFIGIMSVMPKTAYQQGIPKQFLKFDKFDYYWPSFANLGEQPILNKELYIDGTEEDDEVFGYTPRYAEYKFMSDTVHGEFRESLDFWHMGRKFDNRPALNEDFINSNPTDRIFAVLDSEKLYVHVYHKIKAKRPMPYFGTPTI